MSSMDKYLKLLKKYISPINFVDKESLFFIWLLRGPIHNLYKLPKSVTKTVEEIDFYVQT